MPQGKRLDPRVIGKINVCAAKEMSIDRTLRILKSEDISASRGVVAKYMKKYKVLMTEGQAPIDWTKLAESKEKWWTDLVGSKKSAALLKAMGQLLRVWAEMGTYRPPTRQDLKLWWEFLQLAPDAPPSQIWMFAETRKLRGQFRDDPPGEDLDDLWAMIAYGPWRDEGVKAVYDARVADVHDTMGEFMLDLTPKQRAWMNRRDKSKAEASNGQA